MSNIQLLLEKLIKNRIHQVRGWRLRTQILVLFFISALPVILRVSLDRETTKPPEGILGPQSIDTLIPHGFTLVPIEVQNSDSLNSILGNKGIVNLLAPPREEGQKTRLIAQRVPILRAPLNPSQFAVLVPEKI
ncbi:MAG: hypothetical protein KDD35_08750, partial [Bdellovibrionales bacterium]|nr:hypothetical protein [Bdellovibrionales bacterium]